MALDLPWRATVRVDVRKLLRANHVPGPVITLIGGREASIDARVDPSVFGHRGEFATVRGRAQRAKAGGVLSVVAKRDVWRCRILLHLGGRGIAGRSSLLAARPLLRRQLREAFTEFWDDLASQARTCHDRLAALKRESTPPDAAAATLHREVWKAARELDQESRSAAAAPPAAGKPAPHPRCRGTDVRRLAGSRNLGRTGLRLARHDRFGAGRRAGVVAVGREHHRHHAADHSPGESAGRADRAAPAD